MPPKNKKPKNNVPSTEVVNFYQLDDVKAYQTPSHNPYYSSHHLPIPMRCLIIGCSGSMKSNLVLNLLRQLNETFNKIELYCRSSDEPLYRYLENKLGDEGLFSVEEGLEGFNSRELNESYKKDNQTLLIFDDLVQEKNQNRIAEAFLRGRKLSISCLYLTQRYYAVNKIIRANVNVIMLKKVSQKNDLKRILSEYALAADLNCLYNMYKYCVDSSPTSFLLISLEEAPERQFRRNFDEWLDYRNFQVT